MLKSPSQWNKLDLDDILGKGYRLFKVFAKFRYLVIEDLPQEFLIEGFDVNEQFLKNKKEEITAEASQVSIVEIVNKVPQIGTSIHLLLIITFWV